MFKLADFFTGDYKSQNILPGLDAISGALVVSEFSGDVVVVVVVVVVVLVVDVVVDVPAIENMHAFFSYVVFRVSADSFVGDASHFQIR